MTWRALAACRGERREISDVELVLWIAGTTGERGYPPSVREVAEACGYASPSDGHRRLKRLRDAGLITSVPGSPRTFVVKQPSPDSVTTCGAVRGAGGGLPSNPRRVDTRPAEGGGTDVPDRTRPPADQERTDRCRGIATWWERAAEGRCSVSDAIAATVALAAALDRLEPPTCG